MNQSTINETVLQMKSMLQNLSGIMEKGASHAKTKKIEADALLQTRLIADQLPLVNQIQFACDNAKLFASRFSGKAAPVYEDTETTYSAIQERIKKTVSYLETFKEADFKDWESKKAQFAWMPKKYLEAKDYFYKFAGPNFYFHVTTAYSILRANGVELGKGDYIGHLPFQDA